LAAKNNLSLPRRHSYGGSGSTAMHISSRYRFYLFAISSVPFKAAIKVLYLQSFRREIQIL
jgi:hypothetical protein